MRLFAASDACSAPFRGQMLGFASAILIEAATGAGIVGQLEGYAKAAGLLGAQSGF